MIEPLARVFRQKSQDEVQFAGGFEYPAVNVAIARLIRETLED